MANINRRQAINSTRLERWLGKEKIESLASNMRNAGGPGYRWYGKPINLRDVPGSVWITPDGDFEGQFYRGHFASALDNLTDYWKRLWIEAGRPIYLQEPQLNAGFASISDAVNRASQGYRQKINGQIQKTGPTGVVGVTSSLWRVGAMPAAGAAGSAAPDGRVPSKSTTGAMAFQNPSAGTLHLVGANFSSTVINNSLLLYDRIFDVAKTMASTATQAVTGVPSRYQSADANADDYAGGNFLIIEVGGTALAATAHNWTTCTYTDQDGNTGATLPSVTGNASAIVDRLDQPANTWICPLASGDNGIKELTQMQCSASVATGVINFVIGHEIGIMSFPVINSSIPFDWLTNMDQAPRIFDDACLALLELTKPATTATSYVGSISATNAAA